MAPVAPVHHPFYYSQYQHRQQQGSSSAAAAAAAAAATAAAIARAMEDRSTQTPPKQLKFGGESIKTYPPGAPPSAVPSWSPKTLSRLPVRDGTPPRGMGRQQARPMGVPFKTPSAPGQLNKIHEQNTGDDGVPSYLRWVIRLLSHLNFKSFRICLPLFYNPKLLQV